MTDENRLDVRRLPPVQRRALIFQSFAALAPGKSYVLVNDHDPIGRTAQAA